MTTDPLIVDLSLFYLRADLPILQYSQYEEPTEPTVPRDTKRYKKAVIDKSVESINAMFYLLFEIPIQLP